MSYFYENKFVQIIIACLIPFIGGFIVGFYSQKNMHPWYETLRQPSWWNPPRGLFGVVWSILYVLMGYASYRVWENGSGFSGAAKIPLIIYGITLFINWTWPLVFFTFHLIGFATIHLIVLLGFIIATCIAFMGVDQIAGFLYIPYILWITLATTITFSTWRLNLHEKR
ncbi:CLUMA_CG013498, isoform A [Clunio marinus]|uniref:CLUMA_CG013498, isoform A n=1 Tax=Clunio marinus TaxID=568069 RepID=A0A1J1IJ47_9DIPT|nr:CLUMA_CG013498, isoform A [Clunio marinus]